MSSSEVILAVVIFLALVALTPGSIRDRNRRISDPKHPMWRNTTMTKSHPSEVEQAELQVRCPKCGAEPDQWCNRWEGSRDLGDYKATLRVKSGILHSARFTEATNTGLLPLDQRAT